LPGGRSAPNRSIGLWRKNLQKFLKFWSYGHWMSAATSALDVLKKAPPEVNCGHLRAADGGVCNSGCAKLNSVRERLRDVKLVEECVGA
jgi:hypothetical protein